MGDTDTIDGTVATTPPEATPKHTQAGLYAILDKNTVVALKPADGSLLWQYPLSMAPGDVIQTFLANKDSVAIETQRGLLTVLNARDGKLRWQSHHPDSQIWLINSLIFDASQFTLTAFKTSDGKEVWSSPMSYIWDIKMIGSNLLVQRNVFDGSPGLYDLNVTNGTRRWHFSQIQTLTADSTNAYIAFKDNLFALNLNSGAERWHQVGVGARQFWTPAVANGIVFAPLNGYQGDKTNPALLYALNANDGTVIWHTQPSPSYGTTTPAVA